ncbi:MAG: response regulator [Anaerolineae bacterium]|jgi:CheY-like chemotaxis protein
MTNQRHNQTILVADDEPEIVDLVRLLLEWEGYTVAQASNGEEAVAQAQAIAPDLILLDVRMPKMDGLEVLERLQSDPALAGIPVVMLSVVTAYPQVQTALERGAVAYLPKPFELREMARLVVSVLSEDAVGRKEIYQQALRRLETEQ